MDTQERIKAMRKRQEEHLALKEQERQEHVARMSRGNELVDALRLDLRTLEDLQVMTDNRVTTVEVWNRRASSMDPVVIARTPPELSLRGRSDVSTLIKFVVAGDFTTGDVHLTHDDSRVTHDQAVELALAVIESRLVDGREMPGVEVARADQEIPF